MIASFTQEFTEMESVAKLMRSSVQESCNRKSYKTKCGWSVIRNYCYIVSVGAEAIGKALLIIM